MREGDLVRHRHSSIYGLGIILEMDDVTESSDVLWSHDRGIMTVSWTWLAVDNESR